MEPKSTHSPEQTPRPVEYTPTPIDNERLPAYQPERPERSPETTPQHHQPAAAVPATPVQLPTTLPTPVTDDSQISSGSDDTPAVAADEDLIEKEWVDKAKRIVSETREDPYKREREVNKLQADYLKKRYGKDLGSTT